MRFVILLVWFVIRAELNLRADCFKLCTFIKKKTGDV